MTEIEKLQACKEAVKFRKQFNTFEDAWEACDRGDWMLWLASRIGVDGRKLFLAKGKCAELVIHLMNDERSVAGVKAAIAYGNGEIGEPELRDATYAAAYADAAAAYAAATYAYASAYAAYADAAYAAADADAARKETLLKCAQICRDILTEEVMNKLNPTR